MSTTTDSALLALLAGPYKSIRIEPMLLAQDMRIRRVADELWRTRDEVIAGLLRVWSWQAGRWRPNGPWGMALPIVLVDALMVPRASKAMVTHGLARLEAGRPMPAIALERIRGAPDVTRGWVRRKRKAGMTFPDGTV